METVVVRLTTEEFNSLVENGSIVITYDQCTTPFICDEQGQDQDYDYDRVYWEPEEMEQEEYQAPELIYRPLSTEWYKGETITLEEWNGRNTSKTDIKPWVTCASGLTLSIQGGKHYFCYPREDGLSKYETYEVSSLGSTNEEVAKLDTCTFPDGVFENVPFETLSQIIDANGGIIADERIRYSGRWEQI